MRSRRPPPHFPLHSTIVATKNGIHFSTQKEDGAVEEVHDDDVMLAPIGHGIDRAKSHLYRFDKEGGALSSSSSSFSSTAQQKDQRRKSINPLGPPESEKAQHRKRQEVISKHFYVSSDHASSSSLSYSSSSKEKQMYPVVLARIPRAITTVPELTCKSFHRIGDGDAHTLHWEINLGRACRLRAIGTRGCVRSTTPFVSEQGFVYELIQDTAEWMDIVTEFRVCVRSAGGNWRTLGEITGRGRIDNSSVSQALQERIHSLDGCSSGGVECQYIRIFATSPVTPKTNMEIACYGRPVKDHFATTSTTTTTAAADDSDFFVDDDDDDDDSDSSCCDCGSTTTVEMEVDEVEEVKKQEEESESSGGGGDDDGDGGSVRAPPLQMLPRRRSARILNKKQYQ